MQRYKQPKIVSPRHNVRNGLLFIPDISGFTALVQSTDVLTGTHITYELLSAIINQNELGFEIAEVEGDAILFYRYGAAPSLFEMVEQYESMVKAFENKRDELQHHYSQSLPLSLKVVAHYGPMTEYHIGKFKKLYGGVVIEAHRLLKNSIDGDSYLLLTDSLAELTGTAYDSDLLAVGVRSNKLCEIYGALRNICFTYFDFNEEKARNQVA